MNLRSSGHTFRRKFLAQTEQSDKEKEKIQSLIKDLITSTDTV